MRFKEDGVRFATDSSNGGISILEAIFCDPPKEEEGKQGRNGYDPNDWDNPDNCSDREYMDDDDYDDFDHT